MVNPRISVRSNRNVHGYSPPPIEEKERILEFLKILGKSLEYSMGYMYNDNIET